MSYAPHWIFDGENVTTAPVTDDFLRAKPGALLLELDVAQIAGDGIATATLTVTHRTPPLVTTGEPEVKLTNATIQLESDGGPFTVILVNGVGTRGLRSAQPGQFAIWVDARVTGADGNRVILEVL
jgi:hypothetical protein